MAGSLPERLECFEPPLSQRCQGGFQDATTPTLGHEGKAFGVAVGDYDNDGDLDIMQAAGGGVIGEGQVPSPSFLYVNQGDGQFVNFTKEAGLDVVYDVPPTYGAENPTTDLLDLDNDGDLDLRVGSRSFENNGDGFWDIWTPALPNEPLLPGADPGLYRHDGNDNHWLEVELVGEESNRNGLGARLQATSGELQQMREILGGDGFKQREMVAHFSLGAHPRVEQLEIHWPSGTVDVLRDIAADQKIRVFEGREAYHAVVPSTWQHNFPDRSTIGAVLEFVATVRPALFEAEAEITRATADLSAVGGPTEAPLAAEGDGTYRLESAALEVEGPAGLKTVSILIEQATSLDLYWTNLSWNIRVATDGRPLKTWLSSRMDRGLPDW